MQYIYFPMTALKRGWRRSLVWDTPLSILLYLFIIKLHSPLASEFNSVELSMLVTLSLTPTIHCQTNLIYKIVKVGGFFSFIMEMMERGDNKLGSCAYRGIPTPEWIRKTGSVTLDLTKVESKTKERKRIWLELFKKSLYSVYACSVLSDSFWPHELWSARLLCPWDSPGKNIGVGCHFLLQGIFPTQGSNPRLLHWQADSLPLSHLGMP